MKVITSTQYNRPHYTKEMLRYLSRCHGIENCILFLSIDSKNEEVISLCRGFSDCETIVNINENTLTINENTGLVLGMGFERDDFVLHIEEDCIVSRHSLLVAQRLREQMDSYTGSICLYNQATPKKHMWDIVESRNLFVSVGAWGLTKDKYLEYRDANCFTGYYSYDINIDKYCSSMEYNHLYTKLGHSNNIGAVGGKHVVDPEWHKKYQFCDYWAETVEYTWKGL